MIHKWTDTMSLMLAIVAVFSVIQVFIARRQKTVLGWILPAIYLLLVSKHLWRFIDSTLHPSLIPLDIYTVITVLFPAIWLISVFYVFFYRYRCKSAEG